MKFYHQPASTWRAPKKFGERIRSSTGSQIVEFSASFGIFVACVLLPLLDFGIIPIRWMMAREIVNEATREVSFSENFSQALDRVNSPSGLTSRLINLGGIEVDQIALRLRISRVPTRAGDSVESILVSAPQQIPKEWLPDGTKSPCIYMFELDTKLKMSPALVFSAGISQIPGLNAPIPIIVRSMREFEHTGRNPATGKFFINE